MNAEYPCMDVDTDGRSASVIQIESSKVLPIIVILAMFCAGAICLGVFALVQSQKAEREARMVEYYITRLDALLVEQGIKKAGDGYHKE